jgi:hypothetical protein
VFWRKGLGIALAFKEKALALLNMVLRFNKVSSAMLCFRVLQGQKITNTLSIQVKKIGPTKNRKRRNWALFIRKSLLIFYR